jgi:orotidine-5'-phosphate decarboxylase
MTTLKPTSVYGTSTQAAQLYCALDTINLAQARLWAGQVAGQVDGVKLGLEFFLAHGPAGVRAIQDVGLPIFLDLKLHDIPNTVAGAVRAVAGLGVAVMTVHASGGGAMLRAAVESAHETATTAGVPVPSIVGVTVLTSLDDEDLQQTGQLGPLPDQVGRLAQLAVQSGLAGVVSSAQEAALLRARLGPKPLLVVPGIRPTWADAGDQKRIVTPGQAVRSGGTLLVVGRPITAARNPADAARRVREDMMASA